MLKPSMAVGVLALMAGSGLASARASAAEAEPVALIWNAPAGCPTTEAVHGYLERNLAGSVKELAPVAAAVSVVEEPQGHWQATLVVHSHGKRAQRQFEAESCDALAAAAAIIVALAAERTDEDAPGRTAAEAAPPARPTDQPIVLNSSPAPAKPASGWDRGGTFLLASAVLDGGTMPKSPGTGFEAGAGQSWTASLARLRLMGGASIFLPESLAKIPQEFGFPDGNYWLLSISGRGCLTAVLSRFEVGPCFGAELAVMHGSNIGQTPATSTQYWASPLGSMVAAVSVTTDVVVFARTEIVIPSTRRTFLTDTNIEIYKVPSFAVRGALGVEMRFF